MSINRRIGFLIYVGRSGSTLLASLLDSYDDIDVLPETHILNKIIENPNTLFNAEQIIELLEDLYTEKQFNDLKIPVNLFIDRFSNFDKPVTKIVIVNQIIDAICSFMNLSASILIIKTSPYNITDVIYEYFQQDIFFIHLIRDLRAVHRSRLETLNRYPKANPGDSLLFCAYHWTTHISKFSRMRHLYELRYEDLVNDSSVELSMIRKFLGLKNKRLMQVKEYRVGSSQKHLHKNLGGNINKGFATKWKSQLPAEDILILTTLGRKTLRNYNYTSEVDIKISTLFKTFLVICKDLYRIVEVAILKKIRN